MTCLYLCSSVEVCFFHNDLILKLLSNFLTTFFSFLFFFLVQVEQSKVLIKEGGVQLLLTIVDTPGFGDAVDNSNWWAEPCVTD